LIKEALESVDEKGRNMAEKMNIILRNQSGAALVIALIMIVVITLIALASSYTSIFEIAMSGNKRGTTDAFYAADTGISAIIAYPTLSFNTTAYTALPSNTASVYNPFPFNTLNIPNPTNIASSNASITWLQNVSGPPRGGGYSAVSVSYAYFQVQCTGNDTGGSGAQSTVQEEVIEIIPIAQQQGGS
jgi:Tfp pilus assembly protein PilX